jgi:hypothetical protein
MKVEVTAVKSGYTTSAAIETNSTTADGATLPQYAWCHVGDDKAPASRHEFIGRIFTVLRTSPIVAVARCR